MRPRRMSRLSPVQMVLSAKLVICWLRHPVSHMAASYDLIRLTYSSCVPIHTQMKSSPSAIASALYERPTRTDQNVPTFLNCSEGCLGFALSRSKLCRATLCIDSGISLRRCQNSGVARCIRVLVRCRLPWIFWPVRLGSPIFRFARLPLFPSPTVPNRVRETNGSIGCSPIREALKLLAEFPIRYSSLVLLLDLRNPVSHTAA